jgi:[ribosomal protein S5]-alanine N-acetyltransferase
MDIFLKGKGINLTVLTDKDIEDSNWYNWFNDEETCVFLNKHFYPNTKEKQHHFYNSIKESDAKIVLGVSSNNSKQIVGVCSIDDINIFHRTCSISLVMGDEESRTTQNSLEAIYLLIKHAFFTLNMRKIRMGQMQGLFVWVDVLQKNFGVIQEGMLQKEYYKNGQYVDVFQIALFKDDFIKKMNEDLFFTSEKRFYKKMNCSCE